MSENGHPHKSLIGEFVALLEDQMDLAALEFGYEKKQHVRRLGAMIVALFLGLTAFVLLQVALVMGLVALGMPIGWSCLALGGAYVVIAGVLLGVYARRDPRLGEPFQGTREEFRKNLRWIETLFS